MIDEQRDIDEVCSRCREEGRFAFDTEFVMEDRFEPEVCLVQVAHSGGSFLIDPLSGLDPSPVWSIVANPAVETIVHAGQEDLAIAFRATQAIPRNTFDLQIAAGMVGPDYPVSLQKLVQSFLHIRLHKSKTLTDWRKRPLTQGQLRYAAEDVAHLLEIRDRIAKSLDKLGRSHWAAEEMKKFEEPTLYVRAEEDKVLRLKGAGSLEPRELSVLQELVRWREEVGEQVNRPVRTVVKDYLLVEIARVGITKPSEVRDLRGVNVAERHLKSLCEAVERGMRRPKVDWPKPVRRHVETPREAALTAFLTAVIRDFATEQNIAYGLLATKKSIQQLIARAGGPSHNSDEPVDLLQGWRGEAVGKLLEDLLAGQVGIFIDNTKSGALQLRVQRR